MSIFIGVICSFILNVLHLFFSLYLQARYLKCLLFKNAYIITNLFCNKLKKYHSDSEFIEKTVKNFSKIPKHLTFALGEEHVSYEDLVQIILWSLPAGVPVLSFYDHKDGMSYYLKLLINILREFHFCLVEYNTCRFIANLCSCV